MTKSIKKGKKNPSKQASTQSREKAARGSYTMPPSEYKHLAAIQEKCLKKAINVSKSEILRVGLLIVKDKSITEFLTLRGSLSKSSPGRPRKADE
jgi:hypothetical protein